MWNNIWKFLSHGTLSSVTIVGVECEVWRSTFMPKYSFLLIPLRERSAPDFGVGESCAVQPSRENRRLLKAVPLLSGMLCCIALCPSLSVIIIWYLASCFGAKQEVFGSLSDWPEQRTFLLLFHIWGGTVVKWKSLCFACRSLRFSLCHLHSKGPGRRWWERLLPKTTVLLIRVDNNDFDGSIVSFSIRQFHICSCILLCGWVI